MNSTIAERFEKVFKENHLIFDPTLAWCKIGDSLTILHLVMGLEREFSLTIPDADIVAFRTISDVVTWVETNL